eukprot:1467036-Rhodomonas_salina.1
MDGVTARWRGEQAAVAAHSAMLSASHEAMTLGLCAAQGQLQTDYASACLERRPTLSTGLNAGGGRGGGALCSSRSAEAEERASAREEEEERGGDVGVQAAATTRGVECVASKDGGGRESAGGGKDSGGREEEEGGWSGVGRVESGGGAGTESEERDGEGVWARAKRRDEGGAGRVGKCDSGREEAPDKRSEGSGGVDARGGASGVGGVEGGDAGQEAQRGARLNVCEADIEVWHGQAACRAEGCAEDEDGGRDKSDGEVGGVGGRNEEEPGTRKGDGRDEVERLGEMELDGVEA